jgi:hypothetical protein
MGLRKKGMGAGVKEGRQKEIAIPGRASRFGNSWGTPFNDVLKCVQIV